MGWCGKRGGNRLQPEARTRSSSAWPTGRYRVDSSAIPLQNSAASRSLVLLVVRVSRHFNSYLQPAMDTNGLFGSYCTRQEGCDFGKSSRISSSSSPRMPESAQTSYSRPAIEYPTLYSAFHVTCPPHF